MKCDEVLQLHGPYLDSELDAKTTLEIQQHVATCAWCARVFAAEAKLEARIIAGLKQGHRTAALWEQVEQRVVAAAKSASRPRTAILDSRPSFLSALNAQLATLLWPSPRAWARLAAVWLVMLAVNFSTRDRASALAARSLGPPSPVTVRVLKQQEQLLAELVERDETRGADRPKAVPPRPRTERRNELLTT